jgi:hypothetical protein
MVKGNGIKADSIQGDSAAKELDVEEVNVGEMSGFGNIVPCSVAQKSHFFQDGIRQAREHLERLLVG